MIELDIVGNQEDIKEIYELSFEFYINLITCFGLNSHRENVGFDIDRHGVVGWAVMMWWMYDTFEVLS